MGGTAKAANEPAPPNLPLPDGYEHLGTGGKVTIVQGSKKTLLKAPSKPGGLAKSPTARSLSRSKTGLGELANKVQKFAVEHGIDGATSSALAAFVAQEEKNKEHGGHEEHGGHGGHGGHEEGAMPFFGLPSVLQRNGEEQAEVHIGWADIYLDLILVGVAFNGGLLLKHAFYLCTPPGGHGEHGGEHGPAHAKLHTVHAVDAMFADAMPDEPHTLTNPHGHFAGHTDGTGHIERMLSGHEHHEHGPCFGLPVGLLHVMAFGVPIIYAWLKETIFRSRFLARSLFARALECSCYLLMIIGASMEEDVTVLQDDGTFWYVFGLCMLTIDMTWLLRYGIIFFGHSEDCARDTAKEQMLILLPGSLMYLTAASMAQFPDTADSILESVTPLLFGFAHDESHKHIWYIPVLYILGANMPLLLEVFLFSCTSYKPSLPINVHFVLHRATEVFMVLLGESVLQLITSQSPEQPPGTSADEELAAERRFASVQVMGFVITLTIMHSFVITEPEPEYHVLNRGGTKSKIWLLLFITKSLAVWLVGIGIKIALYDPNASGIEFFSAEQRRQIGTSCVSCYLFGNIMYMMHAHSVTKYLTAYIGQSYTSLATFGAWCVTIYLMFYVTNLEVPIYTYMQYQTALGLLHMLIVQLETVWFPAVGFQSKPDEVAGHPSDGKTQEELFREMLHSALAKNAGKIVTLFRQMDEDGDGTVSKEEFRNVDTLLDIGDIPDTILDELFDDWDPDGSGSIELDELNQLLRNEGLARKDGL